MLQKIIRSLFIIPWAISLLPITMLWLLYLISFRATYLIGYWPIAWRDDPFNIGDTDTIYQTLIWCIDNSIWVALLSAIFVHFALHFCKWSKIIQLQVLVFLFGLLLLIVEPTKRLDWWLD